MKTELLDWQEAMNRACHHAQSLGNEVVRLENALGRVAAFACKARVSSPRFDNSAVDGYAICDAKESLTRFELIGEMFAGSDVGSFVLAAGQAVRVLTGAPVPTNCDRVLMQEIAAFRTTLSNARIWDSCSNTFDVLEKTFLKVMS